MTDINAITLCDFTKTVEALCEVYGAQWTIEHLRDTALELEAQEPNGEAK